MTNTGEGRSGERRSRMTSAELLARIQAKRAEIETYLGQVSRRRRLLVNLVLASSALAVLLTGPVAASGKPYTDWLQAVFPSPSWRYLCLIAALGSAVTLIATQMQKSNNYDDNIARARVLRSTLEALDLSVASGGISVHDGTSEFLKCVENCSFIDPARPAGRRLISSHGQSPVSPR